VPSLAASSTGCPAEESLYLHAAGKLEGTRAREVAAHVASCSVCGAALASVDTSHGGHGGAEEPTPEAPIDGRYRVAEVLGRGASATVYRATDTRLGEDVALKVFRHGLGEKVLQEVLIARRVSHPNVCRVYDASVGGEVSYLSMELVRGETLAKRLAERGPAPDPDAPAIVRQVLAGLGAAHAAGVIHRDLKPQNILVAPGGRVVITDFGLARLADEEESRARVIGTPSTWSPEQARGEPATPASDVYSFGVVAYRLLTGRAFRVSDAAPFAGIARPYRAMLERSLALSPRDRAANAAEVEALLARGAWSPWRVAPAGALFVALVALAGWAVTRGPEAVKPEPVPPPRAAPVAAQPAPSPSPAPSPAEASAPPAPPAAHQADTKDPKAPAAGHAPGARPRPTSSSLLPPPFAAPSSPAAPDLLFGK